MIERGGEGGAVRRFPLLDLCGGSWGFAFGAVFDELSFFLPIASIWLSCRKKSLE